MDTNEWQKEQRMANDKSSQINVVLNTAESSGALEIDVGHLFRTIKEKRRVYAWVLFLCVFAGICAPLLLYQIRKPVRTVSSVVTLNYEVDGAPVEGITAPDGNPLDLTQMLTPYVLDNALSGMKLSTPITISSLRSNLKVQRVLTDASRKAQELAAQLNKNSEAFARAQNAELTYQNNFIVSLTNGFGGQNSSGVMLSDSELSVLLNRVVNAYNDYLVETYADLKLPVDEFSVIDYEHLDVLDCLEQLRSAVDSLEAYCTEKPKSVLAYRSWKTGNTLSELLEYLQTAREADINYLYSYIYLNGFTNDKDRLLLNYQYQLRNAEFKLNALNKNIDTIDSIVKKYKNDEIVVSSQETDSSKTTNTPTEYFNQLVLQEADLYQQVVIVKNKMDDLNSKIVKLSDTQAGDEDDAQTRETVREELKRAIDNCGKIYRQIKNHMEELQGSAQYRSYLNGTSASGKGGGVLTSNLKKMVIGGAAGGVIGCGLWFLSALAHEIKQHNDRKSKKEEAA